MKLSATIMAHPVRKDEAERLQSMLDRDVEIIYDRVAVPSKNPLQRWANGRRCWEAHDPSADWHMVIQDDALVSKDLLAGLEKALEQLGPEGLVSAYTGQGKPHQTHIHKALANAVDKGHSWVSTKSLCWGVAIIAPVPTIPDMLRWCSHGSRRMSNYDFRIGVYYRDVLKWRSWYTVPSLVEHSDSPSLVGHGAGRVAHMFHEGSALDVDWSRVPPGGLVPEIV